jgi:hypothetical protein
MPGVIRTMITQQHGRRSNTMFLRNFEHPFVLEQRRPRATERTVRGNVDALVFAEIYNLLLRQQRVVFDLVDCGHDGRLGEQLLHVFDRVVGHADGLDFVWVRLDEFLEVVPCLDVCDAVVDVAGAVGEFGEERVVACHFISQLLHT